jgi:hypothetical protein
VQLHGLWAALLQSAGYGSPGDRRGDAPGKTRWDLADEDRDKNSW